MERSPAYLRPALEEMMAGTSSASALLVMILHSSMYFRRPTASGLSSVCRPCANRTGLECTPCGRCSGSEPSGRRETELQVQVQWQK